MIAFLLKGGILWSSIVALQSRFPPFDRAGMTSGGVCREIGRPVRA